MRFCSILAGLFVFVATSVLAGETVPVAPDMAMNLEYSSDRWVLASKAPDFFVEETAEHLKHELEDQGKQVTEEQLRQIAEKRLAANEAFLFNPKSGAVLTIDFSPLQGDERAPSRKSVLKSAKYAAGSLETEEGVTQFNSSVKGVDLVGCRYAQRIDASYRHHEEPKQFIGIVGFVKPYWVFLYYSDSAKDPEDVVAMNRILEAAVVVPGGSD